jgi:hypothetical protein
LKIRVSKDEKAFHAASEALTLLATAIELDDRGDVVGIDEVDSGLDALALALARLFAFPDAGEDVAPELKEVLSYLASEGQVDEELIKLSRTLARRIRQAGYEALSSDELFEAEATRRKLYNQVSAFLSDVKKELAK